MFRPTNWNLFNVLRAIFTSQAESKARKTAERDPHHGVARRANKRGHTKPAFQRASYSVQERRSRKQMAMRARAMSGMKH